MGLTDPSTWKAAQALGPVRQETKFPDLSSHSALPPVLIWPTADTVNPTQPAWCSLEFVESPLRFLPRRR